MHCFVKVNVKLGTTGNVVGLSKGVYKLSSESDDPFYCLFCLQAFYNQVIADLKGQIDSLVHELNQSSATAEENHQAQQLT